jgi:hypothetical protein
MHMRSKPGDRYRHGYAFGACVLLGGPSQRSWPYSWFCGLVAFIFLGLAPSAMAWERNDVLDAIRIGPRGELGPFQFRPRVWRTYTQKPFSLAADRAEAQLVAELHYDWIKRGLERNGLAVSPYHIGLVWNAGLHATVNSRASSHSQHYAQRVANLVESKQPPRPADSAAAVTEPPKPPQS